MAEFYYSNYDDYFKFFTQHSKKIAEMMSQLNYEITELGLTPVPSHRLFRMTMDLMYNTDQTYKSEKNIPDKYDVLAFPSTNEMLNSMRSVFKEELDRYLGSSNATNQ